MAVSCFRPTAPDDFTRLATFLWDRLKISAKTPGFDFAGIQWKYWSPHPGWEGSRSYVLERGQQIEAHCAVLPVEYASGGESVRAIHFIDWASGEQTLGAGASVLRKVSRLSGATCAVGGSGDTRRILPMMGYELRANVCRYALPLRPFRQMLAHQNRNWKLAPRLARNLFWKARSSVGVPAGWSVEIASPEQVPAVLWDRSGSRYPGRGMTPEVAAWFLGCPIVPYSLFLGRHRGRPLALVLLSFFPGQAHIAGLWGPDDVPADVLYRLAAACALRNPRVFEITTSAVSAGRKEALERCGYRYVDSQPFMIHPAVALNGGVPDFQELDNDSSFLAPSRACFLT